MIEAILVDDEKHSRESLNMNSKKYFDK